MDKLPLMTQLSGSIALLALIWLSICAFRKHAVWGLLVLLFSPIAAAVFGIRHWADAKKPFLTYITTFTLTLSLAVYLFSSWGGWDLIQAYNHVQQGVKNQSLSREDATAYIHTSLNFSEKSGLYPEDQQQINAMRRHLAQLDEAEQARALQEAAAAAAAEAKAREELSLATISKKAQPGQERYRLEYQPIPVADAKNYVGSTVKVTRKGVQEKEYRLTGATANKLQFAQRNSAGTYSFNYNTSDIEKIRVLTRQQDD
jgi:hypothetical protein